jgi:hypothetical protein
VQGLELQTAVHSPELEKQGYKVDLDKATGKLKLMKTEGAPA